MKKFIQKILFVDFFEKRDKSDDFAEFFLHAKSGKKKKFFKKVIAEANADQRKYLMKR